MQYLILVMIFAGSALMVYNVIRYVMFLKHNADLERDTANKSVTFIPLLLLVFFLVGYIGVGISGIANILIASILLGGSIFVFLLLWVMFSIIGHIRSTEKVLAARFEEANHEIDQMTKDSLAVLRVNLTKDEIEERRGYYLNDPDTENVTYSELIAARAESLLDPDTHEDAKDLFTREGLLRHYRDGMTSASEVVLIRRKDGVPTFVRFEATLTEKPVTGEVVAFIVEREYNEEIVRRTLLEKVMMDQYDRIAYILNGEYKDVITNSGKKKGLLLKVEEQDTYESIYLNYFLPAMDYDPVDHGGKPNPLRISVIEKELADKDSYDVDAPFVIDGEKHYKHFAFYKVDRRAKFYIMILSDSTRAREEQEERNRELSEALENALRSKEARVRFFTGISHGLRTPMNGVLGFSDLAMQENDPEKLRDYVSKIDLSVKRLLSMINDLFAMSLIESGSLTLDSEPTDLSLLTAQIAAHVSSLHPEKQAKTVVEAGGLEGKPVLCDATRLAQVLERLLENSLLFANEGSTVKLFAAKEDGAGYVFRITNQCGRLDPELVDHLFESDAWDSNDETSVIPGAGIGMTTAKALIDLMGGTVCVTSDDAETTFEIRFDLESAESAAPAAAQSEPGALHLLVVDDNEINREIAQLMLSGEGHEVDLAVDGADAVEKVKASDGKYDAVFMDVQMPVMNGYEATAAIRAMPDTKLAAIPIIAMTANAYQEDKNEALEAGMDGYVPKPISPDEVRAALVKALSK